MPEVEDTIRECMAQKVWAVVGASRDPARYGYRIFTALLAAGYTAYPVNPSADEIAGHRAYASLADLPEKPGVVDTVVPPAVTRRIVEQAAEQGIGLIWMQPGSESDEAIALAEERGIRVVHHACAMVASLRGADQARHYEPEAR